MSRIPTWLGLRGPIVLRTPTARADAATQSDREALSAEHRRDRDRAHSRPPTNAFDHRYAHKNYPGSTLPARAAGFDSALIVKGLEGGVIPSLQKPARLFYYREHIELESIEIDPASLGPRLSERAMDPPHAAPTPSKPAAADPTSLARAAADRGMEALDGKPGPMRDALAFAAGLCLWHIGRPPP